MFTIKLPNSSKTSHKSQNNIKLKKKESKTNFDRYDFLSDINDLSQNITREDLTLKLNNILLSGYKVISIEGLSGSGKSCFLKRFFHSNNLYSSKNVIIYEAQEDETIEEFFVQFNNEIYANNVSVEGKCKTLLDYLSGNNLVLIIDNFDYTDTLSFNPLIKRAIEHVGNSRLLIVNSRIMDNFPHLSAIARLNVGSYNDREINQLLAKRNLLGLRNDILQELKKKTDFLPIAIDIFCYLVNEVGCDPERLLRGSLRSSDRLADWFGKLQVSVGKTFSSILDVLCIYEIPFNETLFKVLYTKYSDNDYNSDQIFNLQKTFLINTFTRWQWQVHRLYADFCEGKISEEKKEQIHKYLANHCYRIGNSGLPQSDFHHKIKWHFRSFKHYIKCKDYDNSEKILGDLRRDAKKHGLYGIYLEMVNELKDNSTCSSWIEYDSLHCTLITGKKKKALEMAKKQVDSLNSVEDDGQRLSLARVCAEIRYEACGESEAQDSLNLLNIYLDNCKNAHQKIINHALQVKISFLIILRQYKLAKHAIEKLFEADDEQNRAILMVRRGMLLEKMDINNSTAVSDYENALDVFIKINDKRAQAWAMRLIAINTMNKKGYSMSYEMLCKSMDISEQIGECSTDYVILLNYVKHNIDVEKEMMCKIESELVRISNSNQ